MARFTGGWIKLHRRAIDEDIGQNGHILAVWVTLLCWASRFDSKIYHGGKHKILAPGSCVFGIRELADQLRFSKDTVYRALKYLRERDTITITSDTRGTVVTICNWKEYQDKPEKLATPVRQQSNADPTPVRRQPTLNGEVENSKKFEGRINHNGIRQTEYPDDFQSLWKVYGKFTHKGEALRVYLGLKLDPDQYMALSRAVENYLKGLNPGEFKMGFAGFLAMDWSDYANMEREEDWIPPELRGESERRVYQ